MNRIKKLQKNLEGDSAIVITNFSEESKDLFYFTNFEGNGILVVTKKSANLFVPDMEYEIAKYNSKINVKRLLKLENILPKKKTIKISFSKNNINFLMKLKKLKKRIVNIDNLLNNIRSIKEKEEIRLIKKACSYGDRILNETIQNFKGFNTELSIVKFLKKKTLEYGLEISFEPIVANNTSKVHYKSKNKKLKNGFLLIDFGVKYKNYCSDMTRMFYIGKPSVNEIKDYYLIRNIQDELIRKIEINLNLNELEKYTKKTLGKDYIHSLGHGVGLNIHEAPYFTNDKIKEGMVFTIEPGIYRKGKYGVRIEDTIAIVKGKPVILTKSNKDLIFLH